MPLQEKISKFLFSLIFAGVCFILFLPLVMYSRAFFPFVVPKNILFRMAAEIIFAAYLILAYLNPEFRPKFNKLAWSVLAFFGVMAVATFAGLGLYSSFWGNYERMGGLFHYFHVGLYFFVLINVFKNKKSWHSFFTFSIFASIIMSFIAYSQWLKLPFLLGSSTGERLSGTLGNPIYFAAYLLFHLFFILYFLAKEERFNLKFFSLSFLTFDLFLVLGSVLDRLFPMGDWGAFNFFKAPILDESFKYLKFIWPFVFLQGLILAAWLLRAKKHNVRILLAIIFLFEFIMFFATQSRGAVISFFGGLVLFFPLAILLFTKAAKIIKIISAAVLLIAVLSPFALYFGKGLSLVKSNPTLNRLANISLTDTTSQSRLTTWQASWQGWTDDARTFIIGVGPENYYYIFNKYFPTEIYKDKGSQTWFDRPHNIIFDVAATTGLVGLISYLAILILAGSALIKNYRLNQSISSSWLLVALLAAYFGQNFFVFDTVNTEILFYLLLGFIVFLSNFQAGQTAKGGREEKSPAPPVYADLNYIYIAVILVLLAFGLAVNFKTFKANNYLFRSLMIKSAGSGYNEDKFNYYKKAIAEATTGRFEARQQLSDYAVNIIKSGQSLTSNELAVIRFAQEQLEANVKEEPLNVRHMLYLASFYDNLARLDPKAPLKSIELLEGGRHLSPTRPQIYYELGQAYAFSGDYGKAQKYFEQGIALAPRVFDDRFTLLTAYVFFQKFDLAQAQFDFMAKELKWQPTAEDYKRLADIYSRVKKYDKVIEYAEKAVEMEKTAANYAQLAALYAKIGENQKARAAVDQAIKLDANFAAEGKIFLEKLKTGELLEKSN